MQPFRILMQSLAAVTLDTATLAANADTPTSRAAP